MIEDTCSLLYLPGAYDQFVALQKRLSHIVWTAELVLYSALNQLTADWVDLGVLNSHPNHIPLSLFRPPVFCLLQFSDNLTLLMTSNILGSIQSSAQNTTTPEMSVTSHIIFSPDWSTCRRETILLKGKSLNGYLDLIQLRPKFCYKRSRLNYQSIDV